MEADTDRYLRNLMDLVFDPEWGSEFWLRAQDERLDFDPRNDIEEVDDLRVHFPYTDQDPFRHTDVWEFPPRALTEKGAPTGDFDVLDYYFPEDMQVYETGGSTGSPGRSLFSSELMGIMEDFWYSSMEARGVPTTPDGDLLYIGPTGPHAVGEMAVRIGNVTDSLTHRIDLDSRWIKNLIQRGEQEEMGRYLEHVQGQAMPILKTQNIDLLFTTSEILGKMAQGVDVDRLGLKGILHGGTPMDPDTYRFLSEEAYQDTPIMGVYGNALAGTAMETPPDEDFNIDYFSNSPYLLLEVHEDGEQVGYGDEGEIVFHRLTPEMFVPNKPERDKAVRLAPQEEYGIDWDGVRNVGEFENYDEDATTGVY